MADATIIEFVLAAWIEELPECRTLEAKVYPWGDAPQKTATRPFVLYHRISGGRVRSLSGPSGVSRPVIQLDVIGRDYMTVRRLGATIREKLEALPRGYEMGGRTIQVALPDDDVDGSDDDVRPEHANEETEHRVTIPVRIWFVEN